MTNQDLIEKYIYAVVKNLPFVVREDIEKELTTLIYDMLEARCGNMSPGEKDVRVILAELGEPEELANNYSPDKDKCLIGPPYYSQYKYILKIVLAATAVGIAIAGAIVTVIDALEENVDTLFIVGSIFSWMYMVVSGVIAAFAFVTLLFAFFQWKGISLKQLAGSWEDMPKPPKKAETIKRGEVLMGIFMSVLFLIIFLITPQILCVIRTVDGEPLIIPLLDVEKVKSLWYFTVTFAGLGIIREIFNYIEGRYTKKLAIVTGICDFLSLVLAAIWLTAHNLINPEFLSSLETIFPGENEFIISFFSEFQNFFLIMLIFALFLDFGTTLFKALKYDNI